MTAVSASARVRTPRVSGIRVAHETFWHGLRTDGLLISGTAGSDIAKFTFNRRTAFVLKHPDYVGGDAYWYHHGAGYQSPWYSSPHHSG